MKSEKASRSSSQEIQFTKMTQQEQENMNNSIFIKETESIYQNLSTKTNKYQAQMPTL